VNRDPDSALRQRAQPFLWLIYKFDAFISSAPFSNQKSSAENPNYKRSSLKGAEQPAIGTPKISAAIEPASKIDYDVPAIVRILGQKK